MPSGPESRPSVETPSPTADRGFVAGLRPIPSVIPGTVGAPDPRPAADIVGVDTAGRSVIIRVDRGSGQLLLVFLSTDCDGCEAFWSRFRQPGDAGLPDDVSTVIITRGPEAVVPAEVAATSEGIIGVPVIMSRRAWIDYRVTGYPFLVLVDVASRSVIGEAVGMGWGDVTALLRSGA